MAMATAWSPFLTASTSEGSPADAPMAKIASAASRADALVRGGPPGPPAPLKPKADEGVGRGPGGPPHHSTKFVRILDLRKLARAVAEGFHRDPGAVEDREQHVRQRRTVGFHQVLIALDALPASH